VRWVLALLLLGCASAPPPAPSPSTRMRELVMLREAVRPFALSSIESCKVLGRDAAPCVEVRSVARRLADALDQADDAAAEKVPLPRLLDLVADAIALAARYADAALDAFRAAGR